MNIALVGLLNGGVGQLFSASKIQVVKKINKEEII